MRVSCRALSPAFVPTLLLAFTSVDAAAGSRRGLNGHQIAVDPANSSAVYAASNQGIFKSVDGGQSWFEINTGLPAHPSISELDTSFSTTLDVKALAFDPIDSQIVYTRIIYSLALDSITVLL